MLFYITENILCRKINLHFPRVPAKDCRQCMKTYLKPDNSYFENNTDVCFFLGLIKLWDGYFVKKLITVKDPCDLGEKSDRFHCNEIL